MKVYEKRIKLRKWVKCTIALLVAVIVVLCSTHFIIAKFNDDAVKCDKNLGHTCSLYEIQLQAKR